MRTGTNSLTIFFPKSTVSRIQTEVDVFFAGLFCKRLSKKFIFILKLALTNYQPILALLYKILCNILNKSLLSSPFSPRIQSQRHFCKRLLQHVALFSSKLASQRQAPSKTQKPPEQDKPASRAIKLKCRNELLYFSKLSQSSKKSYIFMVRIPYSS